MPATSDRILLLTVIGAALSAVAAVAAWLALPAPAPAALTGFGPASSLGAALDRASASPDPPAEVIVDVEGGVAAPGVHRLPAGARVADAIEAAGGYGPDADLAAAAAALNLAAPLSDGQQIRVPRIGEATAVATTEPAAPGAAAGGGGLVNLNTATPEELDALPGIGPVTVQKIVAAREEAPFASLEDAVARDVLNNGQLEKIRDLATV